MDYVGSHTQPSEPNGFGPPADYHDMVTLRDGTQIALRQIRSDDLDLLRDFFLSLSKETAFLRFSKGRSSIPQEWLERFSNIDYQWDVGLVALTADDADPPFVGLCQIMTERGARRGEAGVVVTDRWQGKGIGALLLERSILLARRLELKSLWALIRKENERALALAFKFGFRMKPESEDGSWELELELTAMEE